MILKGSQRGGGQDLAAHLMRVDENEHVEVHDLRGFVSEDLHGAFREAYAISRATRCRQYLFSLSLNPPQSERAPVEAFENAIAEIERKLGLEGQPRAVVFHEKEGRRHAHCVWSRIDADTVTARPLSHFKLKLRDVSRELYLEHGWEMPRGLVDSRERDPVNFTLTEWQQAKREGRDPPNIKETLQGCWAISDGRSAFARALEERGYTLAHGDRRGHVAVDYTGEVYAISRWVGVRTKDVRTKLGDEADLPSVAEAQRRIAARVTPALKRLIAEARREQERRMLTLAHNKQVMVDRQRGEREALRLAQEARAHDEARNRAARLPHGLRGLWERLTGRYQRIRRENEEDAERCRLCDRAEREALVRGHLSERQALQERIDAARKRYAVRVAELRADLTNHLSTEKGHEYREHHAHRNKCRERGFKL